MKRKSFVVLVAMLAFVLLSLTGCSKYEQITVTSGEVKSVQMNGMRAMDITMLVMISNPAGKVVVNSAEGTVRHFGKVIGKVDVAPFILRPRTTDVYHLDMRAGFVEEFGIRDVLGFVKLKDVLMAVKKKDFLSLINCDFVDELTVDVSAVGKIAGIKVKKTYQDVPLKKLLKK